MSDRRRGRYNAGHGAYAPYRRFRRMPFTCKICGEKVQFDLWGRKRGHDACVEEAQRRLDAILPKRRGT